MRRGALNRCEPDFLINGEIGIRTLDTDLTPYNGLANRRLQPLGHLSCGYTRYRMMQKTQDHGERSYKNRVILKSFGGAFNTLFYYRTPTIANR